MTEADELRVVALVLEGARERVALETVLARLVELGLSEAAAHHAYERVLAGAERVATSLAVEGPSREDDPWGWRSYQYCLLLYPGARLPEAMAQKRRAMERSVQSRFGVEGEQRARARRLGAIATVTVMFLAILWVLRTIVAQRN